MPTISWDEFLSDARELLSVSDKLNDGWELEEIGDGSIGTVYLKKKVLRKRRDCDLDVSVDLWEYHVVYSVSYSVPVLYLRACEVSGKSLVHEKFLSLLEQDEGLDLMVTQTEHPLLHKPYYFIHPCHAADFLPCRPANALISFLSVLAPRVGLILTSDYAVV